MPREKRIRLRLPPPVPAGVTRPTFFRRARAPDGSDTSSSNRAWSTNGSDQPGGLVVRTAMGDGRWATLKELFAKFICSVGCIWMFPSLVFSVPAA
jgi:hypothetical protein